MRLQLQIYEKKTNIYSLKGSRSHRSLGKRLSFEGSFECGKTGNFPYGKGNVDPIQHGHWWQHHHKLLMHRFYQHTLP